MTKYINLPELLQNLKSKGITIVETADTSLTSPLDKVGTDEKKQARNARKLKMTEDELDIAVDNLVKEWPQIEKRWVDPSIDKQTYCLLSFMPSSSAKPDKEGMYGIVKVRGVFETEEECDIQSRKILDESDSYHAIWTGRVGHPLPLVDDNDERYAQEIQNVSLQEKIKQEMSKNVREHRNKEKEFVKEAEQRAADQRAKDDAAMRGEVDEEERYITLRVKRANLIFTLYQMLVSMKRYKDTLTQTVSILDEMDEKFPEFQQTFLAKYNYAAEQAGVPKEKNNIIKYMVGDIPFDLSLIPDTIDVSKVNEPLILPIDVNSLDYHAIAEKMTKAGESKDDSKEEESKEESKE